MKLKMLMCNLNRCRQAHDMLEKATRDYEIDLLLVCEPNINTLKTGKLWADQRGDTALKIFNTTTETGSASLGDGFVWVSLGKCVMFSCYCSPNVTLDTFAGYLENPKEDIEKHERTNRFIIAANFNAKSQTWGC